MNNHEELISSVPGRIWVRAYSVRLMGLRIDARMTVIRLASGKLMLHSPCEITPAVADALSSIGSVAHIVAPGNYHTLYVASAQAAFPQAKTWICPGIERRRPDLRFDGILGDVSPNDWAEEIDQVPVIGARYMREVAMLHRASHTLLLVDLIENYTDATPNMTHVLRVMFRLLGMWNNPRPAPEYRMGWGNRMAVAKSLGRILLWNFDRIIVGHGDIIETAAKYKARAAWRAPLSWKV